MGGLARPGRRVRWREPAELPRGRIFWPRPDIPDTSDLQRDWAKHEPTSALLSCYALMQSDNVTPLSPRTKHFLMGRRRKRYWESFPQAATLLLSGTRPEGADTGLGAGGQAWCDNFEGGKCAMSIRQHLAAR